MYLERRRANLEGEGMKSLRLDGYARTAYTTWSLSYEQLGASAKQLFLLLVFLHREGISENIFKRAAHNAQTYVPDVPPTDAEAKCQRDVKEHLGSFLDDSGRWNDILFLSAMTEIASLSLIEFDKENHVYVLHSLVQDWARAMAPDRKMAHGCTSFLLALSVDRRKCPEADAHHRTIELHVNEVIGQSSSVNANDAWQFARVYDNAGRLGKLEALETQVVESRKQLLGPEDPATLESIRYLAGTYWLRGRHKEAEAMLRQVLHKQMRVLGEENTDTLATMQSLATTVSQLGRTEEAEQLYSRVLDARRRVLGNEHPDTYMTMYGLAKTVSKLGRPNEAAQLYTQVLEYEQRALGEEHPSTLTTMHELAYTLSGLGRLDEAEHFCTQVLNARQRVLGEEHPHTLSTMHNLAHMICQLGRLTEADQLYTQVLDARKRVLGDSHSHTLATMRNLAYVYHAQGKKGYFKFLMAQADAIETSISRC
jgi:tetratricopeptide (TPR) repeat protein